MASFTITWEDVYDFLRCPKILAFKTMELRLRRLERRKTPRVQPGVVGKLGEMLAEKVIPSVTRSAKAMDIGSSLKETSPSLFREVAERLPYLKKRVKLVSEQVLGRPLHHSSNLVKNIVKRDVVGLVKIASILGEEYGRLKVVGRCDVKWPALPSHAVPDLIFKSERSGSYLVAEVKNVERGASSLDSYQAGFYNTLSRMGGLVLGRRREGEAFIPRPETLPAEKISTVLLYPRHGLVEEVEKVFRLKSILKDIWESKQLGLMGFQPESLKKNYCTKCQWRKFCSNWSNQGPKTRTLSEVATPLPLIYVKGALENGLDVDTYVFRDYVYDIIVEMKVEVRDQIMKRLDRVYSLEWQLRLLQSDGAEAEIKKLEKVAEQLEMREKAEATRLIADELGLSVKQASKLYEFTYLRYLGYEKPIISKINRDMASELEPWKKIVRKTRVKAWKVRFSQPPFHSFLTTLGFPQKSEYLINKAWNTWD
ncbi:MAG: hypothetical protein QXT82_11420 [Candidatus Caldarchaeum sp.]